MAHPKEKGAYEIKRKDGSVISVFPYSILGWEEDDRPNRVFDVDKLKHIQKLQFSEKVKVKTIYIVDSALVKNKGKISAILRTDLYEDGSIMIDDVCVVSCLNYKGVVETLLRKVRLSKEFDINPELCVNTTGLGKGIIDYLDECPIPVKKYSKPSFYMEAMEVLAKKSMKINFRWEETIKFLPHWKI